MDQNFEQDIPLGLIIAGFVILTVSNLLIRRWLRERKLLREGQLPYQADRVPSIEERLKGNSTWSGGRIKSSGLAPVIILWLVALTWNLTFGVSFIKSLSNTAAPIAQKIILGIFSLGGFVPVYFAIRFSLRHFRFGRSLCILDGKAGVIGKNISGRIQTSKEIKTTGDYKITLQCLDIYTSGSGKNRSTNTDVQFQTECVVPAAGIRSQHGIPFSIPLPPYPRETGYQLARGTITWQLKIDAPVKGVDYSAVFIVPVFKLE